MLKKYINLGLRNDLNLSDVNNAKISLDNILNDLANPNETFDSDDLLQAIKSQTNSISTIDIRQSDLRILLGITQEKSNANNELILIEPLVTLKDIIDNYRVLSGNPGFVAGGDGMQGIIIPSDAIANTISDTVSGSTIFDSSSSNIQGPFEFWDLGNFSFDGKLSDRFTDAGGMIQWEGYYSPGIENSDGVKNVANEFSIFTNGLFLAEYSLDNVNWNTVSSFYAYERIITYNSESTTSTNELFLGNDVIHVSSQDKIIYVNSSNTANVEITNVDYTTQTISLSNNISVETGNNEIVFDYNRETNTNLKFEIPRVSIGNKIKVRFTVWWKDINLQNKQINFNHAYDDEDVPFSYFYKSDDSNTSINYDSAEYYYKNHINKINRKTNTNLLINESTNILYNAPTNISEKLIATGSLSKSHQNYYVSSTNIFENAEYGDYVIIDDFENPYIFQISEKVSNSSIFIETNDFSNTPNLIDATAHVLKYSGFVGCYKKDEFNNITTISNDFNLNSFKTENLIADFSSSNFFRILRKDDSLASSNITVEDFEESGNTLVEEGLVFVYSNSGILDRSSEEFCTGVFGRELSEEVAAGNTDITLTDSTNVNLNQYVQIGDRIPFNTRVVAIDANTNVITLSQEVQSTIEAGRTITFSPVRENREFCVIPLNTAPPFEGTATGLKTTSVNPNLKSLDIAFEKLTLKQITAEERNANTVNYSKTLTFKNDSDQYSFLIL